MLNKQLTYNLVMKMAGKNEDIDFVVILFSILLSFICNSVDLCFGKFGFHTRLTYPPISLAI